MRYPLVIFILCFFVNLSYANGKNPAPNASLERFAIINIQKVIRLSSATKAIKPQISKIREQIQGKIKDKEKALKAEELSLQEQKVILSPEAYRQRRLDFQAKVTALQSDVRSFRKRLDAAGRAAMGQVNQVFRLVAVKIAAERKIQLILPRTSTIYVDPIFDITDEVLRRLNKRLPTVKVVLPSEQATKPAR